MTNVVSYGQLKDTLGVPASLPPWMTSTLNAPSGNRKCVYRGLSELLVCKYVYIYSIHSLFFVMFVCVPHCLSVGQVVNIKAKVNRAFNTSMEVR